MDKDNKKLRNGTLKDFKKMMKEKGEDDMFACIAEALRNSAAIKAQKDWQNKHSPVEDRHDC